MTTPRTLALALCLSLAGCGGEVTTGDDAAVVPDAQAIDGGADAGGDVDGGADAGGDGGGAFDAAPDDGATGDAATGDDGAVAMDGDVGLDAEVIDDAAVAGDASALDASMADSGVVTCAGASLPSLASGEACEAIAGSGALLITADVLTPDGPLLGGQVLVDGAGMITCVACDCSTAAGAAGATRIVCPDGVLSPGLIDAHEHLGFAQNDPFSMTAERYEQRHDWRIPRRGHTAISTAAGASAAQMRWAELRMVLSGATSINGGSGGAAGLLRNLDRTSTLSGLARAPVMNDTFPLGDVSGLQLTSGCAYGGSATTAGDIAGVAAYAPHVSIGIDAVARQELLCANGSAAGGNDIVAPQTAIMHGIALLPGDIAALAAEGAMLVWSPRSDIALYGDTARVTEYDRFGVPIALGTDWMPTGSMNMLRELECADAFNADYLDGYFDDDDLWRMATVNGARSTGTDDVLGSIAVGMLGDLAIYDGRGRATPHRAVIDASPGDVVLVVRAGEPLFGASTVVPLMMGGGACDALDVCGEARVVCAMREIGTTLGALQASVGGAIYPLFSCAAPASEPSCVPSRGVSVGGGTIYTGARTATDSDGDGLPNATDLCPTVFDPIRPLDASAQADADADGVGDACDPCPLVASTTICPPP